MDYLTARIARDRPDILERMKAGEFKSVRAAAIAAGIPRCTFRSFVARGGRRTTIIEADPDLSIDEREAVRIAYETPTNPS